MVNVSVILPIFNEANIVNESVTEILKKLETFVEKVEIIAVNDGSTDKTSVALNMLQKSDKRIKIVKHRKNKGYGAVIKTGIEHASYPWVFLTDSDLQYDAADVKNVLNYTESYDFIIGFRKKRRDSIRRKFISRIYNKLVNVFFGLKQKDVNCAFKLMRKASLKRIDISSDSFFVSAELLIKANKLRMRIKQIGVNHFPRKIGKSKVTARRMIYTANDLGRHFISLL